ncbi:hypothetical protein ACLD0Q_11845 [Acinetobacter baumannii]|uniref:hypothetical protein n=1 Tax=Acinetobacter baumannii TaxID=470 RepID=UPI00081988E3|nr:hypothetical protein [Acinetobacter baumannii]MDA5695277.1 hypothetical protein [Acinetobacter baumannii]SCD17131.1 Uncharacterised protein [Acinetobacter baumannii]HAW7016875.1 hypothetical protein [Acinetobacter baumannii]HAW7034335.1 hypothetical protein [Acinetobacter baumannii]HAW7038400.1 hypothetical protein [Acinetobacter baumannii]
MISRIYFKCLTCNESIITRTQISHGLKQELNFVCPHCETDSRLVLLLDEPPHVKISFNELENLEYIEYELVDEGRAKVINLSTNFTVPDEKSNTELYSPFLYQMREILEDAFGKNFSPEKINGVMGASNIEELWKDLYKAYKFNIKGNLVQRDRIIEGQELTELIFRFIGMFVGSDRLERDMDILGNFSRGILQKNRQEFYRFVREQLIPNLTEKINVYMEIFDTFFSNYQEFKQMNLQARLEVETFKDSKVSSVNFKRTKMIYGEVFEVLGSNINTVAFLNNIENFRKYDVFQSEKLTYQKYLTADKAGKMKCFEENISIFNIFGKEYDSKLRNATHHKWLKYNESSQIITYPASGSSSEKISLSYTEYLLKTNNIIISLMLLLSFELSIVVNFGFRLNKENPS